MSSSNRRTIQECEEAIEGALLVLRKLNSPELKRLDALNVLAPDGFRPVVELYENGRKKRSTASADSWSPSSNVEIRIYFEPSEAQDPTPDSSLRAKSSDEMALSELLKALQDAETAPGRMFVALKWFRDEYLPATGLVWAQDRDERQTRIAKAIQDGWILTSKAPNPKAPLYPTTTIRLNRQRLSGAGGPPHSRFRPVPISGPSLSSTILRDRGSR
jgi:hypothetical protein